MQDKIWGHPVFYMPLLIPIVALDDHGDMSLECNEEFDDSFEKKEADSTQDKVRVINKVRMVTEVKSRRSRM